MDVSSSGDALAAGAAYLRRQQVAREKADRAAKVLAEREAAARPTLMVPNRVGMLAGSARAPVGRALARKPVMVPVGPGGTFERVTAGVPVP